MKSQPNRQHVFVVIGTRPEAIKMAPVVKALRARPHHTVTLISTGQHGELLTDTLARLELQPDYDLKLMKPGQSLTMLASRLLAALDPLLTEHQPDLVVVHGDTATSFVTALACFYQGIPVAHVEAGLRTNRLDSPFPEEFHRQVIGKVASLHFAPTAAAAAALVKEGVHPMGIRITGNTAIDAVQATLGDDLPEPENLVVVTLHRRENLGPALPGMLKAIGRLAKRFPNHRFVFPAHPNPNLQAGLAAHLPNVENLSVCDPLPYDEFLALIARSRLILSDSGGIQEEAAYLGRPLLLLRDATERPEALRTGHAQLVGCDPDRIYQTAARHLAGSVVTTQPVQACPFGHGGAAERIADTLAPRPLAGIAS